jgi:hypothetical protein
VRCRSWPQAAALRAWGENLAVRLPAFKLAETLRATEHIPLRLQRLEMAVDSSRIVFGTGVNPSARARSTS